MPTHGAQQSALQPVIPPEIDASCTAVQHGTASAYKNHGCRCDTARRAHVRYQKGWNYDRTHGRPRRVPSTGAVRRVRALVALGWDLGTLANRVGRKQLNISHRALISADLHARVATLYDELSATRGPSDVARAIAAHRGWLPPLAWDDDRLDDPTYSPTDAPATPASDIHPDIDLIAIERRLDGDTTVTLTRAEKEHALTHLVDTGHSLTTAANRLGINGTYARIYADVLGLNVHVDRHHADNNNLEETG